MAIITTYTDDTAASDGDKYLTVDEDGSTKLTSLATLIATILAANTITTAMMQDSSVTTAKINDGAVTAAKRSGGFFVGVISGATLSTTGNKTITGVGFTPKLVRFTVLAPSTTSATVVATGAMTTASQYWTGSSSGSASATYGSSSSTAACIGRMTTSTATPVLLASYVSMNADGFTINVSIAGSYDVAYEAYA